MTIPASTVPLAVGYLFDNIKTSINDPAVRVSYGPPPPGTTGDFIVIESISREIVISRMVGSGGAGWLDEIYVVDINCWVFRGGDNGQPAIERSAALADVVISVVRSDPSLGGAVKVANPTNVEYTPTLDEEHRGILAEARVSIRCRATI